MSSDQSLQQTLSAQVAQLLSLKGTFGTDWSVDYDDNLVMVTAPQTSQWQKDTGDSDYPPQQSISYKGTVVDYKVNKVIASFYEEVETQCVSSVSGYEHLRMQIGFEGTILRVFLHGGKVYCSTARKLDCSKSRWGSKTSFKTLYESLGGRYDFFDKTKLYSPHVYFFVVSHPDLLIASKQEVGNGFLVYLGCYSSYSETTCPYSTECCDFTLREPNTTYSFTEAQEKQVYLKPGYLTVEQANSHLANGFWVSESNDPRTSSGEFLVCSQQTEGSLMPRMIKLVSPAYEFRCMVRGNDPNLLHRFYCLLEDARMDPKSYLDKYPWLTFEPHHVTKIKAETKSIICWNVGKAHGLPKEPSLVKKSLMENLCKIFMVALPLHRQPAATTYYFDYVNARTQVVNWLTDIHYQKPDNTEIIPRATKLLELAIGYAKSRKVEHVSAKLLKKNLGFLIENERGPSLYKLKRNMIKFRQTSSKTDEPNLEESKSEEQSQHHE